MNSENILPISLQEACTARLSEMRQELKTDPEYESIIPIRPVLVLQNDKGNEHSTTVIIAPITSKLTKHRIPTHVLLKNPALERISIIMLEQIQTIDQSQLIEYMGEATVQEMNRIERASRISLGMQGVKRYE